jgi:hypothetical protein
MAGLNAPNLSRLRSIFLEWLPIFLLAVIVKIWFPDGWSLLTVAGASYLLTLVAFTLFGGDSRPTESGRRIPTAIAVALASTLFIYGWPSWLALLETPVSDTAPLMLQPTPPISQPASTTTQPLSLRLILSFLGLTLALLVFVAQKTAVDARKEAEQARDEILDGLKLHHMMLAQKLLAQAQVIDHKMMELHEDSDNYSAHSQEVGRFLSLAATSLEHLSRIFRLTQQWLLDPLSISSDRIKSKTSLLRLDIQAMEKSARGVPIRVRTFEQEFRTEHWQPAIRLIDEVLGVRLPSNEANDDVLKTLRTLRGELIRL